MGEESGKSVLVLRWGVRAVSACSERMDPRELRVPQSLLRCSGQWGTLLVAGDEDRFWLQSHLFFCSPGLLDTESFQVGTQEPSPQACLTPLCCSYVSGGQQHVDCQG